MEKNNERTSPLLSSLFSLSLAKNVLRLLEREGRDGTGRDGKGRERRVAHNQNKAKNYAGEFKKRLELINYRVMLLHRAFRSTPGFERRKDPVILPRSSLHIALY